MAPTTYIPLSQKGQPDGVATLNAAARIPVGQLPPEAIGQLQSTITTPGVAGILYINVDAPRFYAVTGMVAALAGEVGAAWQFRAAFRTTPVGGVVMIGTPTVEALGADAEAAAWTIEVVAHFSGTPRINVVGATDRDTAWSCQMAMVEAR